jgi:oligoribonuclease NrnB/cAMP/cGMP phosphodiesterase (DHH superfamily)
LGKTVLELQQQMVNDRVEKNSTKVLLPNGQEAVMVTSRGEYCNLMHATLHEKFPDVKVTMTVHLEVASDPHMRVSFRSYDKEVNVKELAKVHFGGDGSDEATAGGQVAFPLSKLLTPS